METVPSAATMHSTVPDVPPAQLSDGCTAYLTVQPPAPAAATVKVPLSARECNSLTDGTIPDPQPSPAEAWDQCVSGNTAQRDAIDAAAGQTNDPVVLDKLVPELDVWKKLGQGFGTLGGGAVYAFTEKIGVQLNLNLMLMAPSFGFVIEPSLGVTMGF